jgi:hypothetical protein
MRAAAAPRSAAGRARSVRIAASAEVGAPRAGARCSAAAAPIAPARRWPPLAGPSQAALRGGARSQPDCCQTPAGARPPYPWPPVCAPLPSRGPTPLTHQHMTHTPLRRHPPARPPARSLARPPACHRRATPTWMSSRPLPSTLRPAARCGAGLCRTGPCPANARRWGARSCKEAQPILVSGRERSLQR